MKVGPERYNQFTLLIFKNRAAVGQQLLYGDPHHRVDSSAQTRRRLHSECLAHNIPHFKATTGERGVLRAAARLSDKTGEQRSLN
jgi:hypothetical protein